MDELTSTTLTLVCKSLLLDALFEPKHVAIFLFLNYLYQLGRLCFYNLTFSFCRYITIPVVLP